MNPDLSAAPAPAATPVRQFPARGRPQFDLSSAANAPRRYQVVARKRVRYVDETGTTVGEAQSFQLISGARDWCRGLGLSGRQKVRARRALAQFFAGLADNESLLTERLAVASPALQLMVLRAIQAGGVR